MSERLLTVHDTLDRLRITRGTLYTKLLATGELPSVKVGNRRMVRESDLSRYIGGLTASLPGDDR